MKFLPAGDALFDLAETCVTNAEYKTFLLATKRVDQWAEGKRPDNNCPATFVFLDAEAYCAWLSQQPEHEGFVVRLPTEAEWLAAASPDGRVYAWGNEEPDHDRCDFWQEGKKGPDGVFAHPSGAGKYGHLGLTGGVWEWTSSLYSSGGSNRVFRGGSWYNVASDLRSSSRGGLWPVSADGDLGFRCARTPATAKTYEEDDACIACGKKCRITHATWDWAQIPPGWFASTLYPPGDSGVGLACSFECVRAYEIRQMGEKA